jgi:hypothetical protein
VAPTIRLAPADSIARSSIVRVPDMRSMWPRVGLAGVRDCLDLLDGGCESLGESSVSAPRISARGSNRPNKPVLSADLGQQERLLPMMGVD